MANEHPDKNNLPPQFNAAASNTWNYWHTLNQHSRAGEWNRVEELLAQNPAVGVPYQQFTSEMFHRAANQGKLDVIRTMFARGFSLPAEEGAETLKRLVEHYGADGLKTAVWLARENKADATDALYAVAARGTPEAMQAFRQAGCDVQTGKSSFFLAFYEGNADMLRYLGGIGAELYDAPIVAGLYGRKNEVKAADAVLRVYEELVKNDKNGIEAYYAYVSPHAPTLEDLKSIPAGLADDEQTLLHLAARAGCFEDVLHAVEKAKTQEKGALTAQDFLRKDAHGISPLAVLAARQELAQAFDKRLWDGRPVEMAKLHDGLKAFRAEKAIDLESLDENMHLHRLKAKAPAKNSRLTLQPRKK